MNTFPPFHDHHTHISFYSALCGTADLSSCVSTGEALKILKNRKEEIIFARGWKNNLYDIPREELDLLPPAAVCNISLHSFVINSGARDIFSKTHPEIIRDIDNQDWVEHNLNSVFSLFTDYGDTSLIPVFMDRLSKIGILEAEDMSVSSEKSALFMADKYTDRITLWAETSMYEKYSEARKYIHGIKIFADGALGAMTAALMKPCRGGSEKFLLRSDDGMRKCLVMAAGYKKNIAVHAIGDAAIEQVLNAADEVFGCRFCFGKQSGVSLRLEHVQMITLEQAVRARKKGIILSMQPNFSGDSVCYADRLSQYYIHANNHFRMLIDEAGFVPGKDLVFGSDGMPHGAAEAAESAFNPPFPSQILSPEELIKGYSAENKSV
ncbi:MAG: amidohydrolase family protein [Elusimicrobiales bacterium]|nr:amidohydrolase family protein [Elusimicrobiales bacterium]